MPNPSQQLSLTVGIPTYYGAPSLVRTAESILASAHVPHFRFIVAVDGNPLKLEIESALKHLGIEIVFAPQRGGQVARINQMIAMTDTDILVLAQDDVTFAPDALGRIVGAFAADADLKMVNVRIDPTSPTTLFERIVAVGIRIVQYAAVRWNGGHNYLSANGRCQAFRTSWVKGFTVPTAIINSDACFYFMNAQKGGSHRYLHDAVVYNPSPLKVREFVRQNQKFAISVDEQSRVFGPDIAKEYLVPKQLLYGGLLRELATHPLTATLYILLSLYARSQPNTFRAEKKGFWETDVSTKR